MSLSMAVITFLNAWWLMLFLVLPFYTRPAQSSSPLEYAAAPQPVRWRRVILVDTALSLLVTGLLALLIDSGWFHMDTIL